MAECVTGEWSRVDVVVRWQTFLSFAHFPSFGFRDRRFMGWICPRPVRYPNFLQRDFWLISHGHQPPPCAPLRYRLMGGPPPQMASKL